MSSGGEDMTGRIVDHILLILLHFRTPAGYTLHPIGGGSASMSSGGEDMTGRIADHIFVHAFSFQDLCALPFAPDRRRECFYKFWWGGYDPTDGRPLYFIRPHKKLCK